MSTAVILGYLFGESSKGLAASSSLLDSRELLSDRAARWTVPLGNSGTIPQMLCIVLVGALRRIQLGSPRCVREELYYH
ncbi:MAG: hypothetical protein ABIK43_06460 [candidate division WOR-3 bacterium]